jgi:hypothetical protein
MPKYIVPAADLTDPFEQMKLVTLFCIGLTAMNVGIGKPFNPILGETYSVMCGGIPVHLEQISHHPPISSLYIKT